MECAFYCVLGDRNDVSPLPGHARPSCRVAVYRAESRPLLMSWFNKAEPSRSWREDAKGLLISARCLCPAGTSTASAQSVCIHSPIPPVRTRWEDGRGRLRDHFMLLGHASIVYRACTRSLWKWSVISAPVYRVRTQSLASPHLVNLGTILSFNL